MTNNLGEFAHEEQQAHQRVYITPPGESVLAELGIDIATLKSIKPLWKRNQYIAVTNWLLMYKPLPSATKLEQVKGFLEAVYHLGKAESWAEAYTVIMTRLNTPTKEELHNQLNTWGYYREQIELYETVLYKVHPITDAICLNGLGDVYLAKGKLGEATDYYSQSVEIAHKVSAYRLEGIAIGGLGNAYLAMGNRNQAIEYYQKQLKISQELGERWIEVIALIGLGNSFNFIGEFQKATRYYLQSQEIAIRVEHKRGRRIALAGLGNIQTAMGQYEIAIEYYKQELEIAKEIGEIAGEGDALWSLGTAYYLMEDYLTALEYYQQSLKIALDLGDAKGKAKRQGSIGVIYHSLGEYESATNYHQKSLIIARDIGDRLGEGEALANWAITHRELGQYSESLEKLYEALEIFREIENPIEEARVLKSLAEVNQILGHRHEAIDFVEQALMITNRIKTPLAEVCQKVKNNLVQDKPADSSQSLNEFLINQIQEQNNLLKFFTNQLQRDTPHLGGGELRSNLPTSQEEQEYRIEEQPWYSPNLPDSQETHENKCDLLKKEIDAVIITATDVELISVTHLLKPYPRRKKILLVYSGPETYYLGKFGAYNTVVTKCRMGAIGDGSVILATEQAQRLWNPKAIIMVGIAFGKDPTKQKIGDVLVASQIISYEQQRVGEEIIYRGSIPPSNTILLNRFENVQNWQFARPDGSYCSLIVSSILSGEKLVDNPDFKATLFHKFPQAVGGEMEGAGLCAASGRVGTAWILVKSICDWGDGKKHKKHQPLAAAAAASLVHHVLSQKTAMNGIKKL
ncbi:tetratricopeptide repeat protein [Kamptonema formosum]|uniref:tetratricopeptide repeat protein n=1 Tax=Kamptonema formosum TaxID=331992 RepID=UPI0018E1FD4E|nr:tetratricopeptide repeat protein [Oscillatoria sp. PCC 10802]